MMLKRKLADMQQAREDHTGSVAPQLVLENKWYLLEEERAHLRRRAGACPPALGLVVLDLLAFTSTQVQILTQNALQSFTTTTCMSSASSLSRLQR